MTVKMSNKSTDTKNISQNEEEENFLLIAMLIVIIFVTALIIFILYRYFNYVNTNSSSVHKTNIETFNKINSRQSTSSIATIPSYQSFDTGRVPPRATSNLNERKTRPRSRFRTLMCLFARGPGKGKSKSQIPVEFSKFSLSSTGFNINSTHLTAETESYRNHPTELKITKLDYQPKGQLNSPPKSSPFNPPKSSPFTPPKSAPFTPPKSSPFTPPKAKSQSISPPKAKFQPFNPPKSSPFTPAKAKSQSISPPKAKFQPQNIKYQKTKSKSKSINKLGTNMPKGKSLGSAKTNSLKSISKSTNQQRKREKSKLDAKKSKAKSFYK